MYVVRNGAEGAASMPHLGNVPDCWDVDEGAVDDVSVQHEGHVVHRALAAGPGVAAQHLVLAEHLHTPVDKYLDVCRYIYYLPTLAMDVLPTPVSPSITIVAEWTASVKYHYLLRYLHPPSPGTASSWRGVAVSRGWAGAGASRLKEARSCTRMS